MALKDMFGKAQQGKGIDEYVSEARANAKAVILDVRSADEFAKGHIKGAVNVPLNQLPTIKAKLADLDTPLYVHCLSGARSSRAVAALKKLGYANVTNIGGINTYTGPQERGGGGAGGGGGAR